MPGPRLDPPSTGRTALECVQKRHQIRRMRAPLIAIMVLVAAACGGGPQPSLAQADPGRLSLPPEWRELDRTQATVDRVRAELEPEVGPFSTYFVPEAPDDLSFWALGYRGTNVLGAVTVSPWSNEMGPELYNEIQAGLVRAERYPNLTSRRITHPAGEALVVEYDKDLIMYEDGSTGTEDTRLPDSRVTGSLRARVQYSFIDSGATGYLVQVLCVAPPDACLADAARMVPTLGVSP